MLDCSLSSVISGTTSASSVARDTICLSSGVNSVKNELYIGLSVYSSSITWSQWKETGEEETDDR